MTVPTSGETAMPAPTTAPSASVPASAVPVPDRRPVEDAASENALSRPSAPRQTGSPERPSQTDLAIRTHDLTKQFRSGQVAVSKVNIEVPRGAVYGFLGPNGSGKTTTIRMLLGLVGPSDGYAELLGTPGHRGGDELAASTRRRVGTGDDADELVPAVGDRVEGRHGDLGGAGEDDAH